MSIAKRLLILFLIFALIPMFFVVSLYYTNAKNSLMQARLDALENITNLKIDKIKGYLAERRADALVMVNFFPKLQSVLVALDSIAPLSFESIPAATRTEFDTYLSPFQKAYGYVNLMLVDRQGRLFYALKQEREVSAGAAILGDLFDRVRLSGDDFLVGPVFKDPASQQPHLYLVMPLRDAGSSFLGALILEVDLTSLFVMMQNTEGLGETGETLLTRLDDDHAGKDWMGDYADRPGRHIIFLNPLRHDPEASFKRVIYLGDEVGIPAQKAALGESGAGISRDYRGKEVIAAWRPIPEVGWQIVAKIDTEEAFAPITRLRNLVIVVGAITILLVSMLALAVAHSVTKPLLMLEQGSRVVGAGNFDYRFDVDADDEVGDLEKAFIAMIANLKRITASRDALDAEIKRRTEAERILVSANQQLAATNQQYAAATQQLRAINQQLVATEQQLRAELEMRTRAEWELKTMQAQLVQNEKMAAIGQLAAGVAHEINNPLTGVLNVVQLMLLEMQRGGGAVSSDIQNSLTTVEANAYRCKKIVEALLNFSRGHSKTSTSVDLNSLIENTCVLIENEFRIDNVVIVKSFGNDLPPLWADSQLLQQVIFNILGNAKWAIDKKGDGGGQICIETAATVSPKGVSLSIRDTGIGIPKENISKLFDPFFTTKTVGEGIGFGLSLVFSVIKQHKGTISVTSEVGQATTFHVWLPALDISKPA